MPDESVPIVILAGEFNRSLVDFMVDTARQEVERAGAKLVRVVRVPGSYEIPLVADRILKHPSVGALVVLGYIERGGTLHGEVMGNVVHSALMRLSLDYQKPIGIGIIGPGAVMEQAEVRKEDYARAAVRASIASYRILNELNL